MKNGIRVFVLVVAALSAILPVYAQSFAEIENEERLTKELKLFGKDLKKIQQMQDKARKLTDIENIENELIHYDLNFETFLQTDGKNIQNSRNLTAALLELKAAREAFSQSLEKKKQSIAGIETFSKAEAFISAQDTVYVALYKEARKYSLTSKTGKFLAKVKSREAILTAKVEQSYSTAFAAAESIPELKERLGRLEEEYAEMMSLSEKIQSAQYKPFIQRIKDYLMSFAAIAVILMFFSMLQTRIATARQMRANMKKMKETLKKEDDNIPTL